jgi:hypothetical protein
MWHHYFGANELLETLLEAQSYRSPPASKLLYIEIEGSIPRWRGIFGAEESSSSAKVQNRFLILFLRWKEMRVVLPIYLRYFREI